MKGHVHFSFFLIALVCFFGVSVVANSKTDSAVGASSDPIAAGQRPQIHQLNLRMRNQQRLIQKGVRSGSLSKEQAKSLWTSLKTARAMEMSFFKKNGKHELTTTQTAQINDSLDGNSAVLGETPGSTIPSR